MKRYFDLYKMRQCAELDIVDGSSAATALEGEFNNFFHTSVREVSRQKYQALRIAYTGGMNDEH